MRLASVRIATNNVPRLVGFYEQLTGVTPAWGNEQFAEIVTPGATIAISGQPLIDAFAAGSLHVQAVGSQMLELLVDDVDTERDRVAELAGELVMEPTTLPWGNRSLLLRDPDGNVVNLFTPMTAEAISRFASR